MPVEVRNMDVVKGMISSLGSRAPEFKHDVLGKMGENLLRLIKEFAPRKTGTYAESWKIFSHTSEKIVIGSKKSLMYVVLEFGVNHEVKITAAEGKVLHWIGNFGEDRFAKWVVIPPRPPRPHVRTALDDTIRDIQMIASREIRKHWSFVK